MTMSPPKPFLSDIETLRDRARKSLSQGAVTPAYQGDVKKTIEILQTVLATEIVCVLRYTQHSIAAVGISSEAIEQEFATHAREEQAHMVAVAERINQLGKAGSQSGSPYIAIRVAICRGRDSCRYDPREPHRRTHRGRSLSRAHSLFWQ